MSFRALSGVTQGSNLGLLLFNGYNNDINSVFTAKCLMSADGLKISTRVLSTSDEKNLRRSLTNIELWCVKNATELNVEKCRVMTFSRLAMRYGFNATLEKSLLDSLLSWNHF